HPVGHALHRTAQTQRQTGSEIDQAAGVRLVHFGQIHDHRSTLPEVLADRAGVPEAGRVQGGDLVPPLLLRHHHGAFRRVYPRCQRQVLVGEVAHVGIACDRTHIVPLARDLPLTWDLPLAQIPLRAALRDPLGEQAAGGRRQVVHLRCAGPRLRGPVRREVGPVVVLVVVVTVAPAPARPLPRRRIAPLAGSGLVVTLVVLDQPQPYPRTSHDAHAATSAQAADRLARLRGSGRRPPPAHRSPPCDSGGGDLLTAAAAPAPRAGGALRPADGPHPSRPPPWTTSSPLGGMTSV